MDANTLSAVMGGAVSMARYKQLLPYFNDALRMSRVKNLAQFSWMKVVLVDLAGGSRSVVACRVPRGGGCG